MKLKKRWLIPPGVIIAAALVFSSLNGGGGPLTVTAEEGMLAIELDITGEMFAEKSISVSAPDVRAKLTITDLIKDGTVVKEGDVLTRFDPSELQKELVNSEAELKTIEAQIVQKEASLESLRKKYFLDLEDMKMQYEMAKLEMVDDEGILPAKEIEKARLKLNNAELKYKETEKKLKDDEEAALADLRVLKVKQDNQLQQYEFAKESIENMTVRAPASGLVVLREIWKGGSSGKVQVGDSVWRGYSIIELPDLSTLQVKAWASEVDVGKIRAGQRTKVSLDAFPGESFVGEVLSVASVGAKRRWDQEKKEFEVIISLKNIDERMKPGMTVRANITVKMLPNVINIPIEAIFTNEDGEKVVYVKKGLGRDEVKVETGERNATHIEIKEGLSGGEVLYLSKEEEE